MRSNRWHLILVVGLLFGMLNALGIAALGEPGVLKMRLGYEIQSFDPGRFTLHETSIVLRQIYDNLVDFVPGNWPELRGQIAESYEASEDGLTYTFHIRKGIQWQRGYGELTAEDVKFSTERIMDPATESAFRSTWEATIDTVDVLDPYTVRFTLHNPDPAFLAKMAPWRAGPIVSKRAVEEFGEEYGRTVESTIGCGPFILKEYVRGQKAILEKFEGYYGDAPKVNRIEMYVIEDENTALLALQSGEIDMCYIRVPESVPIVTSDANLDVYKAPTATTKGFVSFNTQHPILGDLRVRQALVYALDRDSIAENVGGALAVPACGFLAQYAYWGALDCDELPLLPYDPDKARELLKAAGYPDGLVIGPQYVSESTFYKNQFDVIIAQLAEAGIDVQVTQVDHTTFHNNQFEGIQPLCLYGNGHYDGQRMMFSFFHTDAGFMNFADYHEIDDLLDSSIGKSFEEINEIVINAQQKIMEDLIVYPTVEVGIPVARRPEVDLGYEPEASIIAFYPIIVDNYIK